MKNKYILLSLTGLALLSFSGCSNTADGLGRDIEKAGQKIQDTF